MSATNLNFPPSFPTKEECSFLELLFVDHKLFTEQYTTWLSSLLQNESLEQFVPLLPVLRQKAIQHQLSCDINKIEGIYKKSWYKNKIIQNELKTLTQELGSIGSVPIFLTEIAASLHHPNNSRSIRFIDIYLSPETAVQAANCLLQLGWRSEQKIASFDTNNIQSFLNSHKAATFISDKGIRLIVQWGFSFIPHQKEFIDQLISNAKSINMNGTTIRSIAPEIAFLFNCYEGSLAKKRKSNVWLYDLLNSFHLVNREVIIELAQETQLITQLKNSIHFIAHNFPERFPANEYMQTLGAIPENTIRITNRALLSTAGKEQWQPFQYIDNVSAELNLILLLLNYELNKQITPSIDSYIKSPIDWQRFMQLASRHKISALVYNTISHLNSFVPEEALNKLRKQAEKETNKNVLLKQLLLQLNSTIQREAIEVIWFKGLTQSIRQYNNPLLRSTADIDVLIQLKDLNKFDDLLRTLGYLPIIEWKLFPSSHFSKYTELFKEMSYRHKENNTCIDVHWNLVFSSYLFPYSFRELYDNTLLQPFDDTSLRVLSDKHNYLYLTIHGNFDNWKNLSQLMDIAHYLRHVPQSTSWLYDHLKENQLSDKLLSGQIAAGYLFLNKQEQHSAATSALLNKFDQASVQTRAGQLKRLKKLAAIITYSPQWRYKVKCLERSLFYGDNNKLIRLPPQLFFLYYLSTPVRWMGRKIGKGMLGLRNSFPILALL